jgi:hypothetical protein
MCPIPDKAFEDEMCVKMSTQAMELSNGLGNTRYRHGETTQLMVEINRLVKIP